MSSSSHKSKCAFIASSASLGKCLKNLAINCDARRFSLGDPLTAVNISKYSFSCCNVNSNVVKNNSQILNNHLDKFIL